MEVRRKENITIEIQDNHRGLCGWNCIGLTKKGFCSIYNEELDQLTTRLDQKEYYTYANVIGMPVNVVGNFRTKKCIKKFKGI